MHNILSALKNVGYLDNLDPSGLQLTKQLILDLSNSFVQCTITNSTDISEANCKQKDDQFLSNIINKLDKIENHLAFLEKILEDLLWKKGINESLSLFLEKMEQYNNAIHSVVSDANCIKEFILCENPKGNYQFFVGSLENLIQNLNKNYDVTIDFNLILKRLNSKKIEVENELFHLKKIKAGNEKGCDTEQQDLLPRKNHLESYIVDLERELDGKKQELLESISENKKLVENIRDYSKQNEFLLAEINTLKDYQVQAFKEISNHQEQSNSQKTEILSLEDKNRQLNDIITKCQKEKDLLTISYSRVVKENENFILQSQAHKVQKNDSNREMELLKKNAENMNDIKKLNDKVTQLQSAIEDQNRMIKNKSFEIQEMQKTMSRLDDSKRDLLLKLAQVEQNYNQSKLQEQRNLKLSEDLNHVISELRSTLKHKNLEIENLKRSFDRKSDENKLLLSAIKNTNSLKDVNGGRGSDDNDFEVVTKNPLLFDSSKAVENERISEITQHYNKKNNQNPIDNLAEIKAQNNIIKGELSAIRKDIFGSDNVSSASHEDLNSIVSDVSCSDSILQQKLEKENRILMQIVKQVQSDLRKAALTSPNVQ